MCVGVRIDAKTIHFMINRTQIHELFVAKLLFKVGAQLFHATLQQKLRLLGQLCFTRNFFPIRTDGPEKKLGGQFCIPVFSLDKDGPKDPQVLSDCAYGYPFVRMRVGLSRCLSDCCQMKSDKTCTHVMKHKTNNTPQFTVILNSNLLAAEATANNDRHPNTIKGYKRIINRRNLLGFRKDGMRAYLTIHLSGMSFSRIHGHSVSAKG